MRSGSITFASAFFLLQAFLLQQQCTGLLQFGLKRGVVLLAPPARRRVQKFAVPGGPGAVDSSPGEATLAGSPSSEGPEGGEAADYSDNPEDSLTDTLNYADPPFFATLLDQQRIQTKEATTPNKTSLQNLRDNENRNIHKARSTSVEVSRRRAIEQGVAALLGTSLVAGAILNKPVPTPDPPKPKLLLQPVLKDLPAALSKNSTKKNTTVATSPQAAKSPPQATNSPQGSGTAKLEPINITQVAAETKINVSLACDDGCVKVDPTNFTKVKEQKLPRWYPSFLPTPTPKVIKEISDPELLVAATVAGGVVEMVRTSLLYPIQTVKVRIQTDIHNFTSSPPPIDERIRGLGNNIRRFSKEGNLYAGMKPALLVSVPATGVYYGVRDVSKRMLSMTPMGDIPIALTAALVADVVSLCFRTPADALTTRLQAQDEDVGDWFGDSIKKLPMVIATDIPYLISKLLLTRNFIHGSISMNEYAEIAIFTATLAAFLTTPFDVARTRILVDSDGNFANGRDGGSGEGVIKTMKDVMQEGRGGVSNLFAGWFERVVYMGFGRAWLEPVLLVGYVGLRDALLLQWF